MIIETLVAILIAGFVLIATFGHVLLAQAALMPDRHVADERPSHEPPVAGAGIAA